MNGRPMAAVVKVVVENNPSPPRSSVHMYGEFGEIDLALDLGYKPIKLVDESGEEPEVRPTLDLFTEDTDSMCDEDSHNNLLNNSYLVN
jgi:hypothetical protein